MPRQRGTSRGSSKRIFQVALLMGLSIFLHFDYKNRFETEESETSTVGSKATVDNVADDKRRICLENPYLSKITYDLKAVEDHGNSFAQMRKRAVVDPQTAWNHGRFRPFQTLATCQEKDCIGGKCRQDVSKIMCGRSQLRPGCTVYSIGSNNQWEFERGINQTTPCKIHTFDCTGRPQRFRVPADVQAVDFHYECLDGGNMTTGKPNHHSLEKIMSRHNHTQVDLLKLDIEGYEWGVFEDFERLQVLPMQILVEVHYRPIKVIGPIKQDFKFEKDIIDLAESFHKMGYIIVERDDNRECRHCTELTLLRLFC